MFFTFLHGCWINSIKDEILHGIFGLSYLMLLTKWGKIVRFLVLLELQLPGRERNNGALWFSLYCHIMRNFLMLTVNSKPTGFLAVLSYFSFYSRTFFHINSNILLIRDICHFSYNISLIRHFCILQCFALCKIFFIYFLIRKKKYP